MASITPEVAFELLPYFRAYKDGPVERFFGMDRIPPSPDSDTNVSSKDVVINSDTGLSARIFKPNSITPDQKLPLLVYFHGGAFCFGNPFCTVFHNFITSIVKEANIIAVSVDYRLAPEHPLPIAYEDAWEALNWVTSHSSNNKQEPEAWLSGSVDWGRVFLGGDSAGGNIAHNTTLRAGVEGLVGVEVKGLCLVHPDFASKEGDVHESWFFACPGTTGSGDPRINPSVDPGLGKLGCKKVIVCVAEEDLFRERGRFYYERLRGSGWKGELEMFESEGEPHVFHLFNPTSENALALMKKLASFITQG